MRAAPPTYNQKHQQDVQNEIERLESSRNIPLDAILIRDKDTGANYYLTVETGAVVLTALP